MIIDDLVRRPGVWLSTQNPAGIIISSRIRLARNVSGSAFPGWAGEEERVQLCGRLRGVLENMDSVSRPFSIDMLNLDPTDREVLKERHLISTELAERGAGSALVISPDEHIAIMINEEDHLRLQAISSGMAVRETWQKISVVDDELDGRIEFAYSTERGYLTACPSNVGTGLRASVMMHLAGLRLTSEIDAVVNGLEKMGLAVRGLLGEGSEAHGNMFQVSNQRTLGDTEEAIIESFIGVIEEVARHELNARARLVEKRQVYITDWIARARGLLQSARLLSTQESLDLLSAMRLGTELGFFSNITLGDINEIMLLTQPGHLQKMAGRRLGAEERDEVRASLMRSRLSQVVLEE